MLNAHEPDEFCCGPRISRALFEGDGLLNVDVWECPECGEVWKAEESGGIRFWRPYPVIAIFAV
jgi:hypothetical protein